MKCPDSTSIAPCTCNFSGKTGTLANKTVELYCSDQNLGDSKISEILATFNSSPNVPPLRSLDLSYNSLTRVPKEILLFSSLAYVFLGGNEIRTVHSGAFNFSLHLRQISLADNELTNIEPGAFQGNYIINFL